MSIDIEGRLVLLGAGKMGGAMMQGWLDRGLAADRIVALDPSPPPEVDAVITGNGIAKNTPIAEIDDAAVVVIAIKPQMMADVLPGIAPLAASAPVFLSIAAGTTIAAFEAHFDADAAIVRAMPNTPASVGCGMTVICPNANASAEQTALCMSLLEAVGKVARVDEEALLDAVTAVSGSGPAYAFLLAEAMADAGVEAGLDHGLATLLARTTVYGAGELMRQSDLPTATLRENVTSPGGTTAAALEVLRADGGLVDAVRGAVAAATRRSKELAG